MFWTHLTLEIKVVLSIIFILFCYAVYEFLAANIRLGKERRQIEELPEPRNYDEGRRQIAQSDIYAVRAFQVTLESGEVATSLLGYRDWIQWSRYISGIFVFVGLAGTVWGIGTAVTHLSDTLAFLNNTTTYSQENWKKLLDGISQLLSGMTAVSWCTLSGILSTLVVSFMNTYYLSLCQKVESLVLEKSNDWYYPLFIKQQQLRQNLGAVDIVEASSKLVDAVKVVSDTFDNLDRGVASTLQKLATEVSSATAMLPLITQETKMAFGQLDQLIQSLKTEAQQVVKGYANLEKTLRNAGSTLDKQSQQLQSSVGGLKTSYDEMIQHREGLIYATNAISSSANSMEQALTTLHAALSTREKSVASLTRTIGQTHQSIQDGMNQLTSEVSLLRTDIVQALSGRGTSAGAKPYQSVNSQGTSPSHPTAPPPQSGTPYPVVRAPQINSTPKPPQAKWQQLLSRFKRKS